VYSRFNLRTHAYGMCAWDLFKMLNQKYETEKQSIKENPNSNNLTCSEHAKKT